MLRYLCISIFLFAGSASAQSIVVRTGDHPSFTRIVFSIPVGTEWTIGRTDAGYGVRFDADEVIDPSQFFSRIRRDRIDNVRLAESGAALLLDINCACFAEAYMWRDSNLVVDIKDEDQTRTAAYDPASELPFFSETRAAPIQANPHPPLPPQEEIETLDVQPQSLTLDINERQPLARNTTLLDPFRGLAEQNRRVRDLEISIADGLRRGLSQGLLEPNELNDAEPEVSTLDQDVSADLATLLAEVNAALTPGLSARTSVDSAIGIERRETSLSASGVSCFPDDYADVQNWADEQPFHLQIGALRTAVTSEFDRTDPAAIEALAKTYLYFGFGREAIDVLKIDQEMSHRRQALTAIARIIDGDPVIFEDIKYQLSCPGSIALWSLLAQGDGPLTADMDTDSIMVAFKLLPKILRKHIAPQLARKLNDQNFAELAESALSIAADDVQAVADVQIAASEIAIQQGNTEDAEEILEELVDDSPRATPEALISLVGLKIENDTPVLPSELTMLRTMQFESQDIGVKDQLVKSEAMVLAQSQEFDALLTLMERENQHFDAAEVIQYQDQVFQHSIANESDAVFLTRVFEKRAEPSDPTLQNQVAQRLLDLGFDDQAEAVVSGPTIGADMEERRYLRARIAANKQDLARTQAHLAGIETPRALALLADAGDALTSDQLQDLPENMREEISWRTGNWDGVGLAEDELLQSVASRVAQTPVDPSETETPLAASRSLIDDSEDLRTSVSDLLDRFDVASE